MNPELGDRFIGSVAQLMHEVLLVPGEVVAEQSALVERVGFIVKGSLICYESRRDEAPAGDSKTSTKVSYRIYADIEAFAWIGEFCLISTNDQPARYKITAQAKTFVQMRTLMREDWDALVRSAPEYQ